MPISLETRRITLQAQALVMLLVAALTATAQEQASAGDSTADRQDVAAGDIAASSDDTAGIDDELQEIVLPRNAVFDDGEPYLEDVEQDILDVEDESDEERLSRLFTLYLDAIADRSFDEADALAKQIVELSISTYGLDSSESAKALTNLAIAQHGIRDYESAILNYEAAIGIIERVDDRLAYGLVNPLRGLGAAQLSSGRPDLARDAFDRAIHISHVNEGPHNLEQIETLESLAETYLSVGEFDDAVDIQKRIYYLQARNVDPDSMDIVPALRTRASWQHRMNLYDQERFTWRRIISIMENNLGRDSLELIEPLTSLGKSYLYVAYTDSPYAQTASVSSGEIYLKRAVRVAEANPDAGWRTHAETMIELGDYYMMSARPNRGDRVYEEVWRILTDQDDSEALQARAELLEQINVLQDIAPPRMYGGDPSVAVTGEPPGYETGEVIYEFAVTPRGRPSNIRILESNPEGLDDMYQSVARSIRQLMYRPRFVDGEVALTENVTYRHDFYYREADLPDNVRAANSEGPESP